MIELTPVQQSIYDFIKQKVDEGLPPTMKEIADYKGYTGAKGAWDHVRAIEKKGYIKVESNKARAIRILK